MKNSADDCPLTRVLSEDVPRVDCNVSGIIFSPTMPRVTSDTHCLMEFEHFAATSNNCQMLKYLASANAILFFAGKSSVVEKVREWCKRMLGWSTFTVHRDA